MATADSKLAANVGHMRLRCTDADAEAARYFEVGEPFLQELMNLAFAPSRTVTDNVGLSSQAGPFTGLKVDKKAPAVLCDDADGVWHNANVDIDCIVSDGGSGLAAADEAFQLSTSVPAGTEDANASTGTRLVKDGVLNSTLAGPIAGNMIDRKAPVVTVTCPTGRSFSVAQPTRPGAPLMVVLESRA